MARYNKIHLGPVEKKHTQVRELPAAVPLKPGRLAVVTAGEFALADAPTVGKVWLIQEDYRPFRGVDDEWPADSVAIGIEMQEDCLYAARIANGVSIPAVGTALTTGPNGTLAIAGASDLVLAYAEEPYTNNSGAEQLLRIRPAGSASYLAAAS